MAKYKNINKFYIQEEQHAIYPNLEEIFDN